MRFVGGITRNFMEMKAFKLVALMIPTSMAFFSRFTCRQKHPFVWVVQAPHFKNSHNIFMRGICCYLFPIRHVDITFTATFI